MPGQPAAESAVARGLAYLRGCQQNDGGFVSYSSASATRFRTVRSWRTTFVPALVLNSLAVIPTPDAQAVCGQLARFLNKQQHPNGAFNYWAATAAEYRTMPYPDDLDDTFCALSALYAHDSSLVTEAATAQAVKLLLATETGVGGPYRTWLVPADSEAVWQDTDVAVNANIAYFLSLIGSRLPKLDELLGRTIAAEAYASPYYPTVYPFLYYFARAYEGNQRPALLARVRREQHAPGLAPLNQALCLTAALRLDETRDLSSTIAKLVAAQRRDGSWPAGAFFADPLVHGRMYYHGSAALTTAFACEALQLYQNTIEVRTAAKPQHHLSTAPRDPKSHLLALAAQQCRTLSPELRRTTLELLRRTADSSSGAEIISLPQRFSDSLQTPAQTARPTDFLQALSLANLYGWAAYTVYDDLLDEGQTALLPAANAAMRRSVKCFADALPFHHPFQDLLRQVFDRIDSANAWEMADCRWAREGDTVVIEALPDYGDLTPLADRSYGHALPILAVALAAGLDADSRDFAGLQRALKHYLIARQLNDDLHDWDADLEKGHASYVVTRILAADPATRSGTFQLPALLSVARKQFWQTTLPLMCQELRRQAALARRALRQVRTLGADNVIAQLLDGIDASAAETLAKQRQALGFLTQYREDPAS